MRLHILVGVYQGCLQDVYAFKDKAKAQNKKTVMLEDYELTDSSIESRKINGIECCWNDENEVHLHEVELQE